MGEAADLILDGTMCESCGVLVDGESPGFPRQCSACRRPRQHRPGWRKRRHHAPGRGKTVKPNPKKEAP